MKQIATVVYILGIVGLFLLTSDRRKQTSKALWLPVAWLLINGSRPLSFWLGIQASSALDQSLEGSPFDRNIYLLLLVAGFLVLARRWTTVTRFLRANPAIVLFVLYCAVSISWSDYPLVAFKRWIKLLSDFVMILIVLTDSNRLLALKRLLMRVGFVLIPLSVLLIKYYPELARYYSPWEGIQFVSGIAADKNMLGMTCLVYGLGVWWLFLGAYREQKGRQRMRSLVAYGAVLAMVFWLFHQANSMTSMSCFIMTAGLIAMISFGRLTRRPALVHLMAGAIVGISFAVLFLHIGGDALETMGRNSTLTGRTEIWGQLLRMSGNPFLGTGFESFWVGQRLERIWAQGGLLFGINESHNGYLEIYLSLGWIGVALLAGLIVTGYRNVTNAIRRNADAGSLQLAFLVAAVVYAFTEAAFRIMCPIWTAFLLAITVVPSPVVRRGLRSAATDKSSRTESKMELGVGFAAGQSVRS
jgi:exopolysaccharide production protein ExoQ